MAEDKKNRDMIADILRGIAMLLVVLGHTLSGSIENAEQSFVYNIIWSIQMPLFMLISGYITRYGKTIAKKEDFLKFAWKRTIAYVLPWIVWTVGIRGILFGQVEYLDLKWLAFHMDSGYWFLFTIWVINILYGFSDYLSRKDKCSGKCIFFLFSLYYGLLSIVVLGIGMIFGMAFLGTKLTLYYIPYFYIGVLYGRYKYLIEDKKRIQDAVVFLSGVSFLYVINRVYVYDLDESVSSILLRSFTSLTGCIFVCGLVEGLSSNFEHGVWRAIRYIGTHSLEVYLIHYLLLRPIRVPDLTNLQMLAVAAINYVLTVSLSVMIIRLIESNSMIAKICFGRRVV